MKTLSKLKAALGALALAALTPMALEAQSRPTFIGDPNLIRTETLDPTLGVDPTLAALANEAANGLTWQERARIAGVKLLDERVLVEITGSANRIDFAAEGGVRAYVSSRVDDIILVPGTNPAICRAWVQPEAVAGLASELAENFADARITPYRAPVANSYGFVSTEGEEAMRAHLYGLSGRGVTVAVMDIGFAGAPNAETGEVSFISQLDSDDESSHGTAMIEVIRDIAPEAKIVAYRIDETMDIYSAAMDAVDQGVDLIVSPLSYFDLPGQSLADEAAMLASSNGVQWVNAAGNFADGRYAEARNPERTDVSGDEFVAFASGDPYQFLSDLPADGMIRVHLAQERIDESDAQFVLELYSWDGMSADLVLEAAGNQNQRVQTVAHGAEPGKSYFPMVRVIGDGNLNRMRMFSETGRLHFHNREGSIACPGGTEAVITVGAVDAQGYNNNAQSLSFSSKGGGVFQLTLNLCGPSNCSTATHGLQAFGGTSAAAAHIAGLLTLHKSDKALGKDPVKMIQAIDIMNAGNDIDSGMGLAMARVDSAEPDNDMGNATDLIAIGQAVSGRSLSPNHDQDWFSFEIDEAMSADISFTGDLTQVRLFKEADNPDAVLSDAQGLQALEGLSHTVLNPGQYFILVSGGFAEEYALSLELYQDAPAPVTKMSPENDTMVQASVTETGLVSVHFEWEPVIGLGLIMYQVQVVDGEDPRTVIADMSTIKADMEVSGLEIGRTYVWRVRSMNQYGEADFSADHSFNLVSAVDAIATVSSDRDVGEALTATPVVGGDVTTDALLSPSGMDDSGTNEAAGCTGNSGNSGLIALLIAVIAAAGTMRTMRKCAARDA